jgi:hypothetical protein
MDVLSQGQFIGMEVIPCGCADEFFGGVAENVDDRV